MPKKETRWRGGEREEGGGRKTDRFGRARAIARPVAFPGLIGMWHVLEHHLCPQVSNLILP